MIRLSYLEVYLFNKGKKSRAAKGYSDNYEGNPEEPDEEYDEEEEENGESSCKIFNYIYW